ncbi:MAG: T9SS type B sorting domain-containing protein [Bacteroidetes bacterium]|nr:T9SS type B sorting domain-containing protein [Bacteroidota bacterium]
MRNSRLSLIKNIFAVLAFGFVFLGKMEAQIMPPNLQCVRGDTLFYVLPTNNCGPFLSYDIWASQSLNGPYTLQGSVTNPTQDFYAFVNPSGQQWFFYMTSNYDCPSQQAIPSDTLDNRPPIVSPIQTVSVENGQAVVTWQPSPSAEVTGYIIYRETSIGVIPVDTVYSGNTYTDLNSEPNLGPESYFVNALDPCGNTSIFDAKHTSIFVEATPIPCNQSVKLNWNTYQGWSNGIGEQQIWFGINGGALTMAADAGSSGGSFEVENLVDGATYCFEVHAVEAVTGAVAKSNQTCLQVDIVQSAAGMYLANVSVTNGGDVNLTWDWNPLAELVEYQVLRSDQNADYQPIEVQSTTAPLTATNTYTDLDGGADVGKVFYKIQTLDVCDSVLATNYGSTIYLTATPLAGNINQVKWTPFDFENATVTSYTLYKIVGGNVSVLEMLSSSTHSYQHNYDATNIEEAQACYYVVAHASLITQNGQTIEIESRSNRACVQQAARIFAPNAFVPEGFNQEFKPLIVLGDLAAYEMHIFDRYGQEVFTTNDPDAGWYGQKNGKNLAQGLYVYVIKVTQASGKLTEKRGTVLLIR